MADYSFYNINPQFDAEVLYVAGDSAPLYDINAQFAAKILYGVPDSTPFYNINAQFAAKVLYAAADSSPYTYYNAICSSVSGVPGYTQWFLSIFQPSPVYSTSGSVLRESPRVTGLDSGSTGLIKGAVPTVPITPGVIIREAPQASKIESGISALLYGALNQPNLTREASRVYELERAVSALIKGAINLAALPVIIREAPRATPIEPIRPALMQGISAKSFTVHESPRNYDVAPAVSALLAGANSNTFIIGEAPRNYDVAPAVSALLAGANSNTFIIGEAPRNYDVAPAVSTLIYGSLLSGVLLSESSHAYELPLGESRYLSGAKLKPTSGTILSSAAFEYELARGSSILIAGSVPGPYPIGHLYYLDSGGPEEYYQYDENFELIAVGEDIQNAIDWANLDSVPEVKFDVDWELGGGAEYAREVTLEDFAAKAMTTIRGEHSAKMVAAKADALATKQKYDLVMEGLKWGSLLYLAYRLLT